MLQVAFGLRRKEALMIQPAWADRGNRIILKGTWTKGGRRREIALTTQAQREALDYAKSVAGKGSLIPPSLSYKKYRDGLWQAACDSIGLNGTHGFRHAYAQDRYEVLAGFPCPVRGGPTRDQMTAEQLALDEWARSRVSSELGHGRLRVTNWYLGKG
jgi:integrase